MPTLTTSFGLPVTWSGVLPRTAALSYENAGGDPTALGLVWNVLVLLNQPLLAQWLVFHFLSGFLLSATWNVTELPAVLPVRWRVTGNIDALFGVAPQDSGDPGDVR